MKPLQTEPSLTPPDYFEPERDKAAEATEIVEIIGQLPFSRISERLYDQHEIVDQLLERIWKDANPGPHAHLLKLLIESAAFREAKVELDERNKQKAWPGLEW
ncbi:MAG: hypothetical protein KME67_05145 [Candidatus Thiodiazotropha sp. (ex Codakia orbicularis)]|nr:hypothetical protein [Candidatus Thiodiazotropha sp. (ex Codakia orbicularis)]